jgi:hypothetical protein
MKKNAEGILVVLAMLIMTGTIIFLMIQLDKGWDREEELHKQIGKPQKLRSYE